MFINLTNHPSSTWQKKQIEAAQQYGEIIDMPFPQISPYVSEKEVQTHVQAYRQKIRAMKPDVCLVAGEFSFVFMLVDALLNDGVQVVCSSSERRTQEKMNSDGTISKSLVYDFIRFRPYQRCQSAGESEEGKREP